MAVKPNNAGLPNVKALYEEKKASAAAKAATPVPSRPVAESYSPASFQSLQVPKVTDKPVVSKRTPTQTKSYTQAEIDAQLAAVTSGFDKVIKSSEDYAKTLGYDISSGTPVKINTGGGDDDKNKIPPKKEIIPNVAYDTISKILESYRITGLASVLESIRDEYPEASPDELMTLLQFDNRYNAKFNERFAGNVTRMKAGKPVYLPGEYLKLEQAFDKVLTSYNQPAFKNQSYYDKWIVGDVDPVEVSERVQLGYDRVLSDDPVNRAFTKFYSALGYSDIVAGMLDPVNQLPALQQKVKAAEIGGAALRQGFKADEISLEATSSTLGADILAKQGVTKAEAEQGYSRIASVLPTAQALSSIYSGQKEEQYGRLEAEQEQFQGLASAERKRKRLSELEMSQFKKSTGLGKGALGTTTNI